MSESSKGSIPGASHQDLGLLFYDVNTDAEAWSSLPVHHHWGQRLPGYLGTTMSV